MTDPMDSGTVGNPAASTPSKVADLARRRAEFHRALVVNGTLAVNSAGIPSNADGSQRSSVLFARAVAEALDVREIQDRLAGQTAGGNFEQATRSFLQNTFTELRSLRPGTWAIENLGGRRSTDRLAQYEPYRHLRDLAAAIERDPTLLAVLGNAYTISPDVIITRAPEPDIVINADGYLVDDTIGMGSAIRAAAGGGQILHAVVSCKWTLRSDRAQNARSEALNLIRNRKGRLPHIVVVTGEPTPSRLSSLALGTGDIDCVYHFALPELRAAVDASANDEAQNLLTSMVDGQRLKDIGDLPLDLAV